MLHLELSWVVLCGEVQGLGEKICKKESECLEIFSVDGMTILKLIFKKWDGGAGTRFIWLRIGTGSRLI